MEYSAAIHSGNKNLSIEFSRQDYVGIRRGLVSLIAKKNETEGTPPDQASVALGGRNSASGEED
ncbi:hypothetical protein TK5_10130 [Sideroxyarcus sp. TK5]